MLIGSLLKFVDAAYVELQVPDNARWSAARLVHLNRRHSIESISMVND